MLLNIYITALGQTSSVPYFSQCSEALYSFSITQHPSSASTLQLCTVSVQNDWKVEV